MDATRKLSRLAAATVLAATLTAAPASAAPEGDVDAEEGTEAGTEEGAEDAVEEDVADEATGVEDPQEAEEEGRRIQMAETPRDRVGLVMLGALGLMGFAGAVTAVRQIGGKRPQADGEFRWR